MNEPMNNEVFELDEELLELVSGGKAYAIKASKVNVRSGPGTDFGVNGILRKGAKVTYLKDKRKDKEGKTWLYISDGSVNGWVRSDLLK